MSSYLFSPIVEIWSTYPESIQNFVFNALSVSPDTGTVERIFSARDFFLSLFAFLKSG